MEHNDHHYSTSYSCPRAPSRVPRGLKLRGCGVGWSLVAGSESKEYWCVFSLQESVYFKENSEFYNPIGNSNVLLLFVDRLAWEKLEMLICNSLFIIYFANIHKFFKILSQIDQNTKEIWREYMGTGILQKHAHFAKNTQRVKKTCIFRAIPEISNPVENNSVYYCFW